MPFRLPGIISFQENSKNLLITGSKLPNYFRRFFSTSDVLLAFNKAEKLFEKLESQISDEEILDFYRSWGDFSDDIDDNQSSYRAFTNLERIGKQRRNVLLVGVGLSGKGRALRRQGKYQECLDCNRHAIEYLEKAEDIPGNGTWL